MNNKGISTFKVSAAYIGTVVGAGFATGQEILQFFSKFGIMGLAGLISATIMFIIFGYIIMDIGRQYNANSHLDIIKYLNNKVPGKIIDFIITFFLFGALTTMIAGTGALFPQQFNLPGILGAVVMTIITMLTVLSGINGVINSISFVVPFLLAAVLGTSIYSIVNSPPDIFNAANSINENGLINNWFFAAILYVSYNTIISIAVLGPLGAKAKNKSVIKKGALLGGLGLGIGSIMIYLAFSGNISDLVNLEVPMIYLAEKISFVIQSIYAIILIAEVYTTAVASLYGFVSRLTENRNSYYKSKHVVIITSAAALLASQFGFSNMVKYLYPIVGYAGMLLLISLIYYKIKK